MKKPIIDQGGVANQFKRYGKTKPVRLEAWVYTSSLGNVHYGLMAPTKKGVVDVFHEKVSRDLNPNMKRIQHVLVSAFPKK